MGNSRGMENLARTRHKAYALLSLSYVLVWVASMILPGWQGTFSVKALAGVLCIMAGLMTIFLPSRKHQP